MLKALALAGAAIFALPAEPAGADDLLTGAIRDQAGSAIAGARVTALNAAGQILGTNDASTDGTFALATAMAPAAIEIACAYCRTVRLTVDPGQPVVAIVDRFIAVTGAGPSGADIRALPYRSASDIAALRPFTVVARDRITDRALDRDGAVLVDGLPFYRAADGQDLSQLVPAGFVAAVTAAPPQFAPRYGGYADAGIEDVRLGDPDFSTSRIDLGEASDVVVRGGAAPGGAGYAASSDTGNDREAATARANVPLAGGRLSFDGLGMADSSLHASGAGLAYATDSRRFTTAASVSATQSDDASLVAATARVSNHGPLGWEFGTRAMRATSSPSAAAATQFDGAVYAAAVRETAHSRVSGILAWDAGSDGGIAGGSRGAGLIASFADDLRLGAYWSFHAGAVSNLRIPTFAEVASAAPLVISGDRSLLFEQSVSYADLRRLRVRGMAYTQRGTGSATSRINGIGVDAAWQLAPRLSLRAWALRANQSSTPARYVLATPAEYALVPYGSAGSLPDAGAFNRQLIWLSYEKYIRVDALIRSGAFEGDLRIPFGSSYAFAIGTAQYDGRRVTTFGVTRR